MRPIDADAFFENITGYAPPEMTWDAGDIEHKLDEMSTLTLDDLRGTAKWDSSGRYRFGGKNGDLAVVCTNCFAALTEKEYKQSVWNYCPVCGAKMEAANET